VSPFLRLGAFAVRHRLAVLVTWGALLLIALPLAPRAGSALRAGGFTLDDLEAARARDTLVREIGLPPSSLAVVIRSETAARAGDPAFPHRWPWSSAARPLRAPETRPSRPTWRRR